MTDGVLNERQRPMVTSNTRSASQEVFIRSVQLTGRYSAGIGCFRADTHPDELKPESALGTGTETSRIISCDVLEDFLSPSCNLQLEVAVNSS